MLLRMILLVLVLLHGSGVLWAGEAEPITIRQVTDLRDEARQAAHGGLPILLMFSADHCPFCHTVEDDFLEPMVRSGDYEQKVLIRKIDLDSIEAIRDFNGDSIEPGELARRYEIYVTPTLVYIDSRGRQLAGKMVGLMTPDFYGGYIDEAIDTALARLRRNRPETP